MENRKIFISHSTIDKEYARELVILLKGIGIENDSIFCSSLEENSIPLGKNFISYIKEQLNNKPIALLLLSPNFYNSPMSMCELGAIWGMDIEHVIILIPPMTYNDLPTVFANDQSMIIDDGNKLNSLYYQLANSMNLRLLHPSIWDSAKNIYIKNIRRLLRKK